MGRFEIRDDRNRTGRFAVVENGQVRSEHPTYLHASAARAELERRDLRPTWVQRAMDNELPADAHGARAYVR